MKKAYGIIPPLITPFERDGLLSADSLVNILDFIERYVHGVFICGTYGQGPMMSLDLRKKVAETVIEHVKGKLNTIVHVGSADTLTSVELARHAEDIGANAVASVPPYYYAHSEDAIISHYSRLLESVSIPVYVYNNPARVGYPIRPSLISKLYSIGVKGVKDSSFDLINFISYKLNTGEDFDVIIGTEGLILPGYVLGARAFIAGMSNYLPEVVHELFKSCEEGKLEKARELQFKVNRIRERVHMLGSPIAVSYAVLHERGVDAGYPRPPFSLPERKRVRELLSWIESYLKIKLF